MYFRISKGERWGIGWVKKRYKRLQFRKYSFLKRIFTFVGAAAPASRIPKDPIILAECPVTNRCCPYKPECPV
jgi:hypothetical protein